MTAALQIAFLTDPKFLKPTLVAMASAQATATGPICLHFVGAEFAPDDWAAVERVAAAGSGKLVRHDLPAAWMREARSPKTTITKNALGKLLLPRLIEGRVVYIDGDTLVRRDLSPLARVDLGGAEIAGVPDWVVGQWLARDRSERLAGLVPVLGEAPASGYVNSGVLVLETDAMRARPGRLDQMADLGAARGFTTVDQDRINQIFAGRIALLDPMWNASWGRASRQRARLGAAGVQTLAHEAGGTAVLHFHGPGKPWRRLALRDLSKGPLAVLAYRRFLRDFARRFPDLVPD